MSLAFIFILFLIEFLLIFFLSRQIFTLLYTLFYVPTKHQSISKSIVALLFLPGTMIHEFSHAIIARLLGVKVGDIMLYPHKDKETGELKAGSVEIEKADPIRLSLIGIAPSIVGLLLLTVSVLYMFHFSPPLGDLTQVLSIFFVNSNYLIFLFLFMISMTMFTSRKDLQEVLIVVPALIFIIGLLYYFGFRFSLSESLISTLEKPLTILVFVLGVSLFVDLIVYIFLFVPISLLFAFFGKRL